MAQQTDFQRDDAILASLKRRGGVATAADIAADTGAPLEVTEQRLRYLIGVYKSHLDVDDSGNLLYRFDPEMVRRGEEPGRAWHDFKQTAWRVTKFVFKVGIMVTLVGYTALFVLILLALSVAAIAAMFASDDDSIGGELLFLPFRLLVELLELMFWIQIFDDSRSTSRMAQRFSGRREKKKVEKPFYQKVFDYAFGPEVKRDPMATHRAFAQFVRARRGRVTAAEWSSRTGQSLEEAERALTAAAMRFSGDIEVDDDGVIIYTFDELRVQAAAHQHHADLPAIWTQQARAPSLTGNPTSTNVWISLFNGFNLFMGGAATVLLSGAADTAALAGLGLIPLVFSLALFILPLARMAQNSGAKARAARENTRRQALEAIFDSAESGEAKPVAATALPAKLTDELVRDYNAEIHVGESGQTYYTFPLIAEELGSAREARSRQSSEVVFGQTLFSSDDSVVSLEQSELDDFDARLARELGSQDQEFVLDFELAEVTARG